MEKTGFEECNNSSDWTLQLNNPYPKHWEENWLIEGLIAKVAQLTRTSDGTVKRNFLSVQF